MIRDITKTIATVAILAGMWYFFIHLEDKDV